MNMSGSATSSSMGSIGSTTGPMTMTQMMMVFFTSSSTPLYSTAWAPDSIGQYAGTCVFLIVLALVLRVLSAAKTLLEKYWTRKAYRRRHVKAMSEASSDTALPVAETEKTGVLTMNGVDERVKLIEKTNILGETARSRPWRLSEDVPRAVLVTIMVGISYLLMLAVMTMNVGYFLSVLAGAFLGELFCGRYSDHGLNHH